MMNPELYFRDAWRNKRNISEQEHSSNRSFRNSFTYSINAAFVRMRVVPNPVDARRKSSLTSSA